MFEEYFIIKTLELDIALVIFGVVTENFALCVWNLS